MKEYIYKFFYILDARKSKLALFLLAILLTSCLEAVGIGLIGPFIALASNPDLIQKTARLSWIYEALNFSSTNQFVIVAAVAILNETEQLVTEAIRSLSGQKTMIIIAH